MSNDGPTVLIVEDDEGLAELFEIWLGEDFQVTTVTTGAAALEHLENGLDVVVLDWRMPTTSGAEILDRIRELELPCRVAVVTGLEPEVADIDDDVDAILRKPMGADDLIDTVRRLAG